MGLFSRSSRDTNATGSKSADLSGVPPKPKGEPTSSGSDASATAHHLENLQSDKTTTSSSGSNGAVSERTIDHHTITREDIDKEESWIASDARLRADQDFTAAAGRDQKTTAKPEFHFSKTFNTGPFSHPSSSSLTEESASSRPKSGHNGPQSDESDYEEANVRHLSPFALKLQEKQHQLDGLKSRLGSLTSTFEQMNTLYMESRNSISMLNDFLEHSRTQVETEIRLKSENAKISTDLLDSNHKAQSLQNQLGEAQAELHALRKRHTETRGALETARNELISIRDNNRKVNEEHQAQSLELLNTRNRAEEMRGAIGDLQAKYESLETHAEGLQSSLEELTSREKLLQQKLSESGKQLDEEIKRNNAITTQAEALKRQNSEFRTRSIDLKSQLDVAQQELTYARSRFEEEQRKHDNEVYHLKSEVETLSSQNRVSAQSLKEMNDENSALKDKNRNMIKRMQEIEHLLGSAQKNHERDRNELMAASEKLRELNLRYNAALTDLNHQRNQSLRYSSRVEDLVQENKKLQGYKEQVDLANEQIIQLKGLVRNYQIAMEGRGPAEEMGLTLDDVSSEGLEQPGEPDDSHSTESFRRATSWEAFKANSYTERETHRKPAPQADFTASQWDVNKKSLYAADGLFEEPESREIYSSKASEEEAHNPQETSPTSSAVHADNRAGSTDRRAPTNLDEESLQETIDETSRILGEPWTGDDEPLTAKNPDNTSLTQSDEVSSKDSDTDIPNIVVRLRD